MEQLAILETGGKQYLVKPGQLVTVERLKAEAGASIAFPDQLAAKTVTATVVDHQHTKTVRVVKFHNKTRSYRRHGHRQLTTKLRITTIQ